MSSVVEYLPTLALGGAAAAVFAGWQQVKNFLSYVSSFVVIHAHLDDVSSYSMRLYLKRHFKPAPSGHAWYKVAHCQAKSGDYFRVAFKLPSSTTLFYGKGKFVFASYRNGLVTLSSLRGLIDFDEFIKEVLAEHDVLDTRDAQTRSNFYVRQVIGAEKGHGFHVGSRGSSNGDVIETPSPGNSSVGQVSSNAEPSFPLEIEYDQSINFPREFYINAGGVDPFRNLYYPPEVVKYIEQAVSWMNSRQWYLDRGIPWRRGWLLYGPGGTGKSSLARALAIKLRIPLNHFYLNTLSDQEFIREWDSMCTPSVVLLEDFDTCYDKRQNLTEHKLLSFDTILNKISGVGSSHGIFLIVTTNHINKIDEALGVSWDSSGISTRPGRIDHVIYVGYMEHDERVKMAQQILSDWPDAIPALVDDPRDITPIQFQELCVQEAFKRINHELS